MLKPDIQRSANALSSLMAQTKDTMVNFEFIEPVDPAAPEEAVNQKMRNARVAEASRSFARYFGYERREDVIGRHLVDLFNHDIPPWFIDYGSQVQDRRWEDIERELEIPVGTSTRLMRVHMQNIWHQGLLTSQWITMRDITEEDRARKAIQENDRLRQLAVDAIGLKTFALSVPTRNGAVQSPGNMRVADESVMDWWAQVHAEDRSVLERAFRDFCEGGTEHLHAVFRSRDEADNEIWLESWAVASARDETGIPSDLVGVVLDRTQHKAMERQLQYSQRLESLGVMAGGIAHDFNNLLMSIVGTIEVLKHKHPQLASDIDVIDQAAAQATQLCEQLLTYAGRGASTLTPVNLEDWLVSCRDLLQVTLQKQAQLKLTCRHPDVWVQGDSSQLNQVLLNLVKNASDAINHPSGEISVTISTTAFDESSSSEFHLGDTLPAGLYASLLVTDNGGGMSEDELQHLFDPFFTTKFAGRGLGLAVVMGIVRAHGGAIRVTSTPEQGTSVEILLPLTEAGIRNIASEDDRSGRTLQGHVLIVDDDPGVLASARSMAETLGLHCTVASSGREALEVCAAESHRFDVVLLDITMPEMNGIETALKLLQRNPRTNILLSSGYSAARIPEEVAGTVGFLKKPYRLQQLELTLAPYLKAQST